jgi:ABC-type Co2+ transport system permease subunit
MPPDLGVTAEVVVVGGAVVVEVVGGFVVVEVGGTVAVLVVGGLVVVVVVVVDLQLKPMNASERTKIVVKAK